MVTKAIIMGLSSSANNKYLVRIPLFENYRSVDNRSNYYINEATVEYSLGCPEGYSKDDIVYITFENNDFTKPVIIGKLWLGVGTDNGKGAHMVETLSVSNKAYLPVDTRLGSAYTLEWVLSRVAHIDDLDKKVEAIDNKILTESLKNIEGYSTTKTQSLKNINGVFKWVDD